MTSPKAIARRAVRKAALSRIGRPVLGAVAPLPPAAGRLRGEFRGRINIIYYHYVGEPTDFYASFDRGVTLARLDEELAKLGKRFTFAPLDQVIEGRNSRPSDPPLLAVTFDDGFDLLGSGVADVLERHGVLGTSFLITACLDNRDLMWRNKLSALRAMCPEGELLRAFNDVVAGHGLAPAREAGHIFAAADAWPMGAKDELADAIWASCPVPSLTTFLERHRPYFDEAGLREWLNRGHSIGLHTRTHPYCDQLDEDEIEREIVAPAADLRRRFGLERVWFSYPFGLRLPPAIEERLVGDGVIDCALGTEGCAPRGTARHRLERASAEKGLGFTLYGRTLLAIPGGRAAART
jgi:peptidoglycan/xylan/chitin deacetylase (PgdA/CDA1 family)